jgi:hypothetical protein
MSYERPTVEFIRVLYESTTARISDIAAIAGVGERTIVRYAKDENWRRRGRGTDYRRRLNREAPETEMSKHRSHSDGAPGTPDRRRALVERLYAAAEKHLDAIEARLAAGGGDVVPLESAVPHFALFSRTVQQIALIDQATTPAGHDDEFPRGDDELRRELTRKMDALVAARTGALSREPDAG